MNAPAAIQAQLVDVRNVSSHKCVRLEIHVPAEQAGVVMAAFGWPTMAEPVPVALARLVAEHVTPDREDTSGRTGQQRRAFPDLPYAQQAALRCQEADFARFLAAERKKTWDDIHYGKRVAPDAACAEAVRRIVGVNSRSEIRDDPADAMGSGFRWRSLDAEYFAWQRGRR